MSEEQPNYPPNFIRRPPTAPMIIKRDGHVEPFDRAKMLASMRSAGQLHNRQTKRQTES